MIIKKKIPEDKKKKLLDYFKKKDDTKKGYLITKLILSGAVRKFISRVLTGQRDDREINPTFEIFSFMEYKEDIWKNEVLNNANFSVELNELSEIDIHVDNAVELYDALGGDKILLGEKIVEKVENKQSKDQKVVVKTDKSKKPKKKPQVIF